MPNNVVADVFLKLSYRILVLIVTSSDMSFMELVALKNSYSLPIGVVRCVCAHATYSTQFVSVKYT